jgi:hypothetical protein
MEQVVPYQGSGLRRSCGQSVACAVFHRSQPRMQVAWSALSDWTKLVNCAKLGSPSADCGGPATASWAGAVGEGTGRAALTGGGGSAAAAASKSAETDRSVDGETGSIALGKECAQA